ncbi:type VI secretion system baseplate subunit TssE [Pyxidicoccus xibeiensis]|uniref:type VI secretion system baseplate subunit TssE n=1 Tax=Pyxidicoccus xibeiensis TaxID=2906759 RepID=UPI0020A74D7D|nr:type VI secretion system baseplate subunit TssE [Pyxidicoccus xibeiensis]MCP3140666.1 type VI secretion system baseplate subunit TssE [Pyxidicoccus xibeiensis]
MAIRGLLSRLDLADPHALRQTSPVDTVVEHLKMLLNTRKGQVAANPDYGIRDFNDVVHSFPAAIHWMQASIQQAIETFEPRLNNVFVLHVEGEGDPFALQFEITAQLVHPDSQGLVRLRTRVGTNGRIELS